MNLYCCRIPLQEDDGPYAHSTSSMHSEISTLVTVSRIYADLCMRDGTKPSDLVALPLGKFGYVFRGGYSLTQIWFLDPLSLTLFGRAWLIMVPSYY